MERGSSRLFLSFCEDFLQHRGKWRTRGRLHSDAQVSNRGKKHRAPPYQNRAKTVLLEVRNRILSYSLSSSQMRTIFQMTEYLENVPYVVSLCALYIPLLVFPPRGFLELSSLVSVPHDTVFQT